MGNKRSLFLMLVCLLGSYSYSQSYLILVKPVGSKTAKYINLKGEVIIDRNDPVSYQFSEDGIAVIGYPKKNLYQLINRKGEVIPTAVKDFYLKDFMGYDAQGFSGGSIIIKVDKKYGCLDAHGSLVVPVIYDKILEFNDGYGIGKIGDEYYVLDNFENVIHVEIPDLKEVKRFHEHLAPYVTYDMKFGFINEEGTVSIPCQFKSVGYFHNGLAWAKNFDGLAGYINTAGEWVIRPQFLITNEFDKESGLARVKGVNNKWFYIDEMGVEQSIHIPGFLADFSEGLARGKDLYYYGFYNNKGEWAIKPSYENVRSFKNGFAAAKFNGLWGIIDTSGQWVIQPSYAGIKDVIKLKD